MRTDILEKAEDLRDAPIFICGHPKSGTSLVRALLDSHPQLVVYPEEMVFFRRVLPKLKNLDLDGQLTVADQSLIHIFKWDQANPDSSQAGFSDRDYRAISYEHVREIMRQFVRNCYRHPGDLLSAAVLAYGFASNSIRQNTRGWVEKSPYNELYAEQIYGWWPEARCIHILREPRDNFASYRRKHPDWRPEFFAANWSRSIIAGEFNLKQYGAQRYMIVRYEDLAASPEVYLKKLADFLQIDWDATLMSPTRAGDQWGGNSMFEERFNGISDSPIDRWKSSIAEQDADIITIMTRNFMGAWGYQVSLSPDLRVRLAARWRSFTWPMHKRLYHKRRQQSRVDEGVQ